MGWRSRQSGRFFFFSGRHRSSWIGPRPATKACLQKVPVYHLGERMSVRRRFLVTHQESRCIGRITTPAVFHLSPQANNGDHPSWAPPPPPPLCQPHNGICEPGVFKVWDRFPSNAATAGWPPSYLGQPNGWFLLARSLAAAAGELTAKSKALFAEGDSSAPQSQGGVRGFTSANRKHLPVAPKYTLGLRASSNPRFIQDL